MMKTALKIIAIVGFSTCGITLIFGGKVLTTVDYIGLWCVTANGYILAKI